MSVIVALTAVLLVTHFVNTVLAVCTVHPLGVPIFSLAVNVNVNVPLVHAASVILHVGFTVSISLNVTVTSFTEFSLSFIVITHVSLHVLFALGVYVNVLLLIVHVHFPPFVFTPL